MSLPIILDRETSLATLDMIRYVLDLMPRDLLRAELKARGLPVGAFKSTMVLELAVELAQTNTVMRVSFEPKPEVDTTCTQN